MAYTRSELATLGIYIDAKGAITTTKQLAGELDALGKKGAAVAGIAGGSVAPAIQRVEGAARSATPGLGRLGNQFGSLTAQMVGVHPVAMNIVGVLGNFITSSAVMAGVLAGLALLSLAWRKITADAREAKNEMKAAADIIKGLALKDSQGSAGPEGAAYNKVVLDSREKLKQLNRQKDLLAVTSPTAPSFNRRTELVAELQRGYDELVTQLRGAQRQILSRIPGAGVAGAGGGAVGGGGRPFDPSKRIDLVGFDVDTRLRGAGGLPVDNEEWIKQRMVGKATAPMGQMTPMAPMLSPLEMKAVGGIPVKLDSLGTRIADGLKSVSGELLAGLASVATALIIGGGGRGAQIGGGLGASIGGGIGAIVGIGGGPIGSVVGGAVGSVVGALAGSLFGGLFDKKKKVASGLDMMATQLARVNEQLRNMPSGYKVRRSQYDATNVGDGPEGGGPTGGEKWPVGHGGGGGSGGGGGGVATMPKGGGTYTIGVLNVMANSPQQLVREIERAVASVGTRGGSMRLARA